MEIFEIKPQGFCFGVVSAINLLNKALKDPLIQKPIYMLGDLVHNKYVINDFKEKGVIVLNGDSREKLLNTIIDGTVILTAHGVSDKIYQILEAKKLKYIDTTCPNVFKTAKLIKEKLQDGYHILYLGVKNHPETEGVISNNNNITLITLQDDLDNLNLNYQKIFFTNQTTISTHEVEIVYNKLKQKFPNILYSEEVCSATKLRQNAVIEAGKLYDLIIVVGDKSSNNSKELKNVCLKHTNAKCELIDSYKDLNSIDFLNITSVGITSGASTPKYLVDEVIDSLKKL
ncbi:MAG: 4-hydroxy-3-methylbut-2-enyl diphosphate reductase [Bacilli bacterium]|nr:4-hydroxy-3-methylbut-2-enyl diphosphate reductase [Bacilli bacterium]